MCSWNRCWNCWRTAGLQTRGYESMRADINTITHRTAYWCSDIAYGYKKSLHRKVTCSILTLSLVCSWAWVLASSIFNQLLNFFHYSVQQRDIFVHLVARDYLCSVPHCDYHQPCSSQHLQQNCRQLFPPLLFIHIWLKKKSASMSRYLRNL